MAFTEDEKRAWLEEKRKREQKAPVRFKAEAAAECVTCGNRFGYGEGTITAEVAICDVCNGD